MTFYPENPEEFIPKSSRYRCPHCGENSFQKEMFARHRPRYIAGTGRLNYSEWFKCQLCGKTSYKIHKENGLNPVASAILATILVSISGFLFYRSGLSVKTSNPINIKYALLLGAFILATTFFFYIKDKLKLPGWIGWQTSSDGTPAPGRRIKVKFIDEPRFEKVIKQWAIYDIEPVGKGGLIYAQCEQVFCNAATMRIIKCKNYNAPTGDEIKIIDGKKSVIGNVYEETEPAKPIVAIIEE